MTTKSYSKWIDISQPLTNLIGHWPGDTPFEFHLSFSKQQTGSVNIGRMTTSLHTGTHVDAPFHFDDGAKKIHELDLELFIGPARVIDVSEYEEIGERQLRDVELHGVTRILLKTNLPNNPNRFPDVIPHLHADLGPYFKELGIILVGVDVPSVDPLDSKEMSAHHSLHQHGVHILENIMLDHVDPGDYELIALPLPIVGADGSPVRACIRKIIDGGL